MEHDLFRKPVSIPDQVRNGLFRDHALGQKNEQGQSPALISSRYWAVNSTKAFDYRRGGSEAFAPSGPLPPKTWSAEYEVYLGPRGLSCGSRQLTLTARGGNLAERHSVVRNQYHAT